MIRGAGRCGACACHREGVILGAGRIDHDILRSKCSSWLAGSGGGGADECGGVVAAEVVVAVVVDHRACAFAP